MATRERVKAEKREKARDRRPFAEAKYIRIPSSKVEIVLDLVRGKMYAEAAAILSNTNKSACEPVLKVLNSAAANAENNSNMPKDTLYVAECWAAKGPTLKRMMPRARGRADRIFKGTCHITIILDEKEGVKATPKRQQAKAAVKKEGGTSVKKETVKPAPQKKNTTSAKPQPDIHGERPLTKEPNNKKPLGTKKETDKPGAKSATVKKETK